MKTKFNGFLTLLLVLVVQFSFAQERNISGVVSDEFGPVGDITIVVKGTDVGTVTDFDGNYTIKAKTGDVMVFSHISYETKEVNVGTANNYDVKIVEAGNTLQTVIVTAQGIKREKKALGYAVSTVSAESIEGKPESDIAKILNGKMSGVKITPGGGLVGSGTSISIRDKASLTGSSEPLFVVDGVPFSSDNNNFDGFSNGGSVTSSRFLDLDPNSIASVSVLKGLSATVLYGEKGSNGVVVITTKKGKKTENNKIDISVLNNTFFTNISNLPDFQNRHGSGYYLGNNEAAGTTGSWGPAFDSNVLIPHLLSSNSALETSFPEFFGTTVPNVGFRNNVKDFFNTGVGSTNSISISKSMDNGSFNFSFSHTDEDGFVPENGLKKNNFSLGGQAKLANNFTMSGAFNFAQTKFTTPPISGNGGESIFANLLFTPRNLDLNNLPFQDPVNGGNVYYRTAVNPLWLTHNSKFTQDANRFFSNMSLTYKLNDHVSFLYRLGFDTYSERQTTRYNKDVSGSTSTAVQNGYLRVTNATNELWDHTIIASFNYELTDKIGLVAQIGGNSRSDNYDQTGVTHTGQVVFDFFDPSNFEDQSNADPLGRTLNLIQKENTVGLFSQLEFDYNDYLFLTVAARNDKTSKHESDNNSVFYPSASLSFLPTKAIEGLKSDAMNYLKIRGAFGSGAGFAPSPFSTRSVLQSNTDGDGNGLVTQTVSDFLANPNLKPELYKEFELGIESKWFKNRISLEVSAYKRTSKDLITLKSLPNETGFTSTFTNIGRVDTEGVEMDLGISIIKSDNFKWDVSTNFFAYETTVKELESSDTQLNIGGFSNAIGNFAIEGEPLGVFVGSFALRDDNGNFLVSEDGLSVIPNAGIEDDKIIGDPNPDWTGTVINTFTYKGIGISAQMEYVHGGDISSRTHENLVRRGVIYSEGLENRDLYGVVIPGIYADADGVPVLDGSGNTIANNTVIALEDFYFFNVENQAAENIYDGTTIRLREVALSYSLPKTLLERTPFGSVKFSVYGQNLWYKAVNFPDALNFDPETLSTGVGNTRGIDLQTTPSSKKYGFSVQLKF